jgi:hypothetical protein
VNLTEFIIQAKLNTYASKGEGGEKKLPDGAKELTFEQDKFSYRDRYFGFNNFIGEEIVWENKKPIWGMNYYGQLLNSKLSPEDIYTFLQKCLRKIPKEQPYRGPDYLKETKFEYFNESTGDLTKFLGLERISFGAEDVFKLVYHGGLIT